MAHLLPGLLSGPDAVAIVIQYEPVALGLHYPDDAIGHQGPELRTFEDRSDLGVDVHRTPIEVQGAYRDRRAVDNEELGVKARPGRAADTAPPPGDAPSFQLISLLSVAASRSSDQ